MPQPEDKKNTSGKKKRFRLWHKIAIALPLLALLMGGPVYVTSRNDFCNNCHIMDNYYASWEAGPHSEVHCLDCHLRPGLMGYVEGKMTGLAQAVDCAVGRVGTKPSATVLDVSCLRSDCHSTETLSAKPVEYKKFKFAHQKHLGQEVDGVRIQCTTCHNHLEGNEHFSVNTQVCFTCHFLKSDQQPTRQVDTKCTSCHNIPEGTRKRGWIEVDHEQFVAYEASCEESCHQRQIDKPSVVPDTACWNCHDFAKSNEHTGAEMHRLHSGEKKVECFSCHGRIEHGPSAGDSISEMLECQSCHSDTHGLQQNLYTAGNAHVEQSPEKMLSPMFLSHVQCNGCHVQPVRETTGTLSSLGTVAKATPQACDRCHEAGTGERFVPFWQDQIKGLYERTEKRIDSYAKQVELDENSANDPAIRQNIDKARELLQLVQADGSWGVHNLKYTEDMLTQARKLVSAE